MSLYSTVPPLTRMKQEVSAPVVASRNARVPSEC